jgi:hypothetical protein
MPDADANEASGDTPSSTYIAFAAFHQEQIFPDQPHYLIIAFVEFSENSIQPCFPLFSRPVSSLLPYYSTMSQTYHISIGPMGFVHEDGFELTVLRGHTRFSIKSDLTHIKHTRLGAEVLRQIMANGRRYPFGSDDSSVNPSDLVYRHCLPLLTRLVPQTELQDLSLEPFLHSPSYDLELVDGGKSRSKDRRRRSMFKHRGIFY